MDVIVNARYNKDGHVQVDLVLNQVLVYHMHHLELMLILQVLYIYLVKLYKVLD